MSSDKKIFKSSKVSTAEEWKANVSSHHIVISKWSTSYCPPCKRIQPFFDQLAAQFPASKFIVVEHADDQEFEELTNEYNINGLPTFQLFVDGKLKQVVVGANENALNHMVQKYCAFDDDNDGKE